MHIFNFLLLTFVARNFITSGGSGSVQYLCMCLSQCECIPMASHVMVMYRMRCMASVYISNNKLSLDVTDIRIHSKSSATLTLQDLMQVIVANMCANELFDLPSTLLTR